MCLKALIRDDFRCMVTGVVDMASYGHNLVIGPRPSQTAETECAHIFPESLGVLEDKDPEREVCCAPRSFLRHFR